MYWTTPSGTRYQTGMPAVHPVAAVGGADRQGGHLDQAHHALGQVRVGEVEAGPGHADEVRQVEQLLVVAPADDLGQGVGAGDEEQLRVRDAAAAGR